MEQNKGSSPLRNLLAFGPDGSWVTIYGQDTPDGSLATGLRSAQRSEEHTSPTEGRQARTEPISKLPSLGVDQRYKAKYI